MSALDADREDSPRFRRWLMALLVLAVASGALAGRLAGLESQFGHVDDLCVAKIIDVAETRWSQREKIIAFRAERIRALAADPDGEAGNPLLFADRIGLLEATLYLDEASRLFQPVATSGTTYAPLQFHLTQLLLSSDLSYSQTKVRGRLPAFLCSLLAPVLLFFFYRRLDEQQALARGLPAIALTALSLEGIVYANHMSSYAIGTLAVVLLLFLLVYFLNAAELTASAMRVFGVCLFLAAYAQYQLLFFLPALFVTIFLGRLLAGESFGKPVRSLGIAGVVFGVLFAQPYVMFLSRLTGAGLGWNIGPSGEYAFIVNSNLALGGKLAYAFDFFLRNGFAVLGDMTALAPDGTLAHRLITSLLTALFVAGLIGFVDTKSRTERLVGVFLALTALTWVALVVVQKIALSPTRHSLVLLPLFAITIAQGIQWLSRRLGRLRGVDEDTASWRGSATATLLFVAVFGMHLPQFLAERQDPFDEDQIATLLEEYEVDAVFPYDFTVHPLLMPSLEVPALYLGPDPWWNEHWDGKRLAQLEDYRVAFLSHQSAISPEVFEILSRARVFDGDMDHYTLIFSDERSSDREMEFSDKTKNGSNGFYFYIYSHEAGGDPA